MRHPHDRDEIEMPVGIDVSQSHRSKLISARHHDRRSERSVALTEQQTLAVAVPDPLVVEQEIDVAVLVDISER